jgi:hypothetical protein
MTVVVRSETQVVVVPGGPASTPGPPGPPGTGTTIGVENHSVSMGTAFERLNFTGAGVTLSGGGADVAIDIPGVPLVTPQQFGALGSGGGDDTAAFASVFDGTHPWVHIPAGTYIVSSFSIPANTVVTTDGHNTIIKQKSGTGANTRIIKIVGSNVHLDDISVEGRLNGGVGVDTTGEQNHGIFIALEASSTASLSDITIGNVRGTNIRGDVVYIGTDPTAYTAGYRLSQVRVGQVIGSNVFRNVVSVTGGSDIEVASASGTQVGQYAFDCEPDTGNGPVTGLMVGYIKGRTGGFVSPAAGDYIEAEVGHIDLDPSYTTDSTPAYGSTAYQHGLWFRNVKSLSVDRLYANGHYGQAIKPVTGGLVRQSVTIKAVEIPLGCTTEATNLCFIFGDASTYLEIGTLFATTSAITNHAVFNANTNFLVGSAQIALAPSTHYSRGCTGCKTGILNVSRVSGNGGTIDLSGTRNRYGGGVQLCDYFFNFAVLGIADGVDATAASSYDNGSTAGSPNFFIASKVGGAYSLLRDVAGGLNVANGTDISVPGAYQRGGTQVLGARKTGWATATGTATRTTFDTASVTLPQLAERLKALIDDFHATAGHGAIGP